MNADAHIRVVLEVFAAIEQRDAARFQAHTHPGSPSAGRGRCPGTLGSPAVPTRTGSMPFPGWKCGRRCSPPRPSGRWTLRSSPPPPTGSWCTGASGDVAPTGLCFDGQVLGLYEIQGERLAGAQTFYFDTEAVSHFLADAGGRQPGSRLSGPPTPHHDGW
jgi:hypothetical protein